MINAYPASISGNAFVYQAEDRKFVRLDLNQNSWQSFDSWGEAHFGRTYAEGGSSSLADLGSTLGLFAGVEAGAGLAVRLGASVLGRMFGLEVATLGLSGGAAGASGVAAKEGSAVIKGFTQHAAAESAITRGFKTADILKIAREGTPEVIRNGTQIRYTLQGNSIVVQQTGRNAGKVVTVFSNAPGTAKGFGKGFLIPWK